MMPFCPFDGEACSPNCMMFLTFAEANVVERESETEGEGACSVAVMASHTASENHYGGNYLVKSLGFRKKKEKLDD